MSFTFHVRPGTTDQRIVDTVYRDNVYRLPPNMKDLTVIDIGANIGAFTIACAERGARVRCFEPEPSNHQLLLRHIYESDYANKIDPFNYGVGGSGIHKLYVNHKNYGANSQFLSNNICLKEDTFVYMYMVSASSMIGIHPVDVLKIDCEGGEIAVLESLLLSDKLDLVRKIMVEFHESPRNKEIQDALAGIYNVSTISDHEFIYTK